MNPNFCDDSGSVRLLRELEKREHYEVYTGFLMLLTNNFKSIEELYKYITTPGLLADKLLEWNGRNG